MTLILLLQVVIQHTTVNLVVLIPSSHRYHRVWSEPLLQAGITFKTRNVRNLPSLRYPRYAVLAHELAIHVETWQVHLIALDWDFKLCICHVCVAALCIHMWVFLDLIASLSDQEAELSKDEDEEFDEIRSHTHKDNGHQNVPSLLPMVIVSKEVGQVQQRVEKEGYHHLVED